MDIQVLNDARADLASRMAMLDVPELNYASLTPQARVLGNILSVAGLNPPVIQRAQAWLVELSELEKRHGYASVEATLEYYIEMASSPQSISGLGDAVLFYLDSLFEWEQFGSLSRLAPIEGRSAAQFPPRSKDAGSPLRGNR